MANNAQLRGTPFSQTAGTLTANAIATQASQGTLVANYVTDVSGSSSDTHSRILVKDGATTIWQDMMNITAAGTSYYQHTFATPLKGTAGTLTSVTVEAPSGSGTYTANVSGFFL